MASRNSTATEPPEFTGDPCQCDICGKYMSRARDVNRHKQTHSRASATSKTEIPKPAQTPDPPEFTGDPRQCDICGKYMSRAHDVKRHKETHRYSNTTIPKQAKTPDSPVFTGDPRQCDICGKYLSRAHDVKRHKETHRYRANYASETGIPKRATTPGGRTSQETAGVLENGLKDRILKLLSILPSDELKALEIAENLGLAYAKDVNPTLYKMQKMGLVEKLDGSPPKWKIRNNGYTTGVEFVGSEQDVRPKSHASGDRRQSVQSVSQYRDNFEEVAKLGEGGFGIVFKARQKLTSTEYAVKMIMLENSERALKKALKEVKALEKMNHPNIVRYFSVWTEGPGEEADESDTESGASSAISDAAKSSTGSSTVWFDMIPSRYNVCLFIQMELCQTSNLADWLLNNPGRDKDDMLLYFRQIVDAVSHIHSLKLIHRDLKPSNILFSMDRCLKIGDFGLVTAQEYSSSCSGRGRKVTTHTGGVGTKLYQSPEQRTGGHYSQKVDIYSLGVIFIEIMSSFSTEMERRLELQKLTNSKGMFLRQFYDRYPAGRAFVTPLLADPEQRPTADKILENPLLRTIPKSGKQFLSQ